MSDVDALLAKAQPRTEPFRLLIDTGDGAVEAYNALADALAEIPDDKAHAAQRTKAKKAIAEANERLRGQQLTGRLRALPLLAWEELKGQHPPREGVDADMLLGVSLLALPDMVRACITEPDISDAQWTRLLEVVPKGEWYRLWQQVESLNEQGVSIPKLPSDFLGRS